MFCLRLFVIICAFLSGFVNSYRKPLPLTEFIQHYETLNYDREGLSQQHGRIRRSAGTEHIRLSFNAHGRDFRIRLRRDTELFTNDFVAENVEFDHSKVVTGHVEGDENSLVHGFISDGIFEGKIHTSSDEYHIENGKDYFSEPTEFHSVIYRSNDVHYPHAYGSGCGLSDKTKRWMEDVQSAALRDDPAQEAEHNLIEEPVLNRYRRAPDPKEDPNKKVCTLLMQADHLFTANVAGGNKERAVLKMTQHVKAIIPIFKKQLRDAQFIIKRMRANDSDDLSASGNPYAKRLGVEKVLELNSLENHDDVCLAYIFTYRDFADGVLGLAWVGEPGGAAGGICERYIQFRDGGKKSLNTGVVTFLNYGADVPQKVSEITFAHEAGHNFGSPHDTSGACAPGGSAGNFVMFAKATSGDKTNNRRFSSCSTDAMTAVINVKGWCTDDKCCFIEPGQPICGNGVVEAGEQCDCGYFSDKTCQKDKCCNGRPDNGDGGCTLTPDSKCSPSEGPCCNPDSCSILNTDALCLNETECANDTFCNGMNATCPQPPPKGNLTECNEGRQVCLSGSCAGSICLKHGLTECQCTDEDLQCHVCCEDKGVCSPTQKVEGIMKELKHHPGAPCDDFNGYCDVFLKCRKVDADGPLARLKNKFFSKEAIMGYIEWIKTYWWAVVLMGVGLILLMAGFIKLCSVHTPSSNPNRKPARQLTLRRQQQQRNQRARQPRGGPGAHDDPPPYSADMEMAPGHY